MKKLAVVWNVLMGLIYLVVVIGILSVATTRFETLVLAGIIQVYAAVLYNFSVIGVATDANNYAGFLRFRILANERGITENEDGPFEDQAKAIAEQMKKYGTSVVISRFSNGIVSIYALFKIVEAIL